MITEKPVKKKVLLPFSRKNIKANKIEYRLIFQESFEKIFFDLKSGGYLACHHLHGILERNQNLITGKILAKNGLKVKLLEAIKNVKCPDARVDNHLWEFKMIKKAKKNISNAVQNHFQRAALKGGQSPNLVIHIHQDFDTQSLISGLERAIKADKENYFQKTILLYQDKLELIYRREIQFGKAAPKILRMVKTNRPR